MKFKICLTIAQAILEMVLLGCLLVVSLWGLELAVGEFGVAFALTALFAVLVFSVIAVTAIIYRAVMKIDFLEEQAEAKAEAARKKESRLYPYL